jgi:hypothetical protein
MGQMPNTNRQLMYTEARLAWLLEAVDDLHTAMADGTLGSVTTLPQAEVVEFLYEVIYVARETLDEIETKRAATQPKLALVRKSS